MRLPGALCTKQTAQRPGSHKPQFRHRKPGVKLWMGKRNPVKLVSAVVKRKSAVVTGNLFEANIPPTTISPLPIATRVIMTCKIVKAPTDIPRIMGSPLSWRPRSYTRQRSISCSSSNACGRLVRPYLTSGQCAQKAGTQRKTSPATATWQVLSKLMFVSSYTWVVTVTVRARAPGRPCP
jgi:hypothetical protein